MPSTDEDGTEDEWWKPSVEYHDNISIQIQSGGRHLRDVRFHDDCTSIVFSLDGRRVYCGLKDGTVRVLDSSTWEKIDQFRIGDTPIECLAISRSGFQLVAGSPQRKKISTWDLRSRKLLRVRTLPKPWQIEKMKLSSDGQYVAVDGFSGTEEGTRVWDAGDFITVTTGDFLVDDPNVYAYTTDIGKLVYSLPGSLPDGQQTVSPSGKLLLSNGQIWSLGAGIKPLSPLSELAQHPSPIFSKASYSFSPDGSLVVMTSIEEVDVSVGPGGGRDAYRDTVGLAVMRIFDGKTGRLLRVLRPTERPKEVGRGSGRLDNMTFITGPTFSPSGEHIAVAVSEGLEDDSDNEDMAEMMRLVSISDGKVIDLPNGGNVISSDSGNVGLVFSTDGRRLAAIVYDQNRAVVRVWDVSQITVNTSEKNDYLRAIEEAEPPNADNVISSVKSDDFRGTRLTEKDRRGIEQAAKGLLRVFSGHSSKNTGEKQPDLRKKTIPAHEAIHIAFERYKSEKASLQRQLNSRSISSSQFDQSMGSINKRLIADFGKIFRGRSREEALEINMQYSQVYQDKPSGPYEMPLLKTMPQWIDEVVGDDGDWKVKGTLMDISDGDSRVGN